MEFSVNPKTDKKMSVAKVIKASHPMKALIVWLNRCEKLLSLKTVQIKTILIRRISEVRISVTDHGSCVSRMMFVRALTSTLITMHARARNALTGRASGPCRKTIIQRKDLIIVIILLPKIRD